MAALVRIVPFLALLCCIAVVVMGHDEDHHDPTHGHGDHHPFDGVVHECQHDSPKFQAIQEVLHNQPRAEQRYGRVDDRGFHTMSVGGIRFAVSTLDLDDTTHYCTSASGSVPDMQGGTIACSASTVFTAAMKSTLINYIIPAALSRLSGAISVDQIQGNLMVPSTSACGSPWTIPSSHVSTGIANADYVVYVSAAPTSGNVIAWAGYCSKDQNGRPFVGRMNFSPAYIYWSTTDMSQNQLPYNTLTHELTHALGFSYTFATTGFKSGVNVVTSTTVRGGQPTNIVTSAKVLAAGKTYFGCSTTAGVELEDEGSSGTMNSHWERRNLMQELMNGMTDATGASGSRMSVMTLSYLEDTGYYYIDYTKADAMQYGNNQGCSFLNNKCDSTSPQLGTYWCSDTSTSNLYCTWDQKAIGYCATGTYSSALASYWQYFSNPNIGGTAQLVDYCPMVQYYSNRICNNASYVPDPGTEVPYGFVFGTDSRCVVTSSGFIQNAYAGGGNTAGAARCLHSRCPGGTRIQYSVDGTTWVNCPTDGSAGTISAPTGYTGTITCPTAASFCDSSLYYGTTTAASTTTTVAGTTTTSGAATTTAVGATTTPSATTVTPPPPSTTTTTTAAAATPTPGSSTCDTSYLLSTSSPSPSSVLSVASINAILTAHNNARRTVSPYAQVMPMLTWNQSLADFAQNYMNTCPGMVHSTSTMRSNVAGFSYIGENLAAGSSNATYGINGGAASTSLWVGEQQYWSYGQVCQSGQVCGHYTQVIWAATLQVGCGWAYCPNQPYLNYWSCNYGPGGNYVGQNEYVSTTTSPSVCQIQTGQTTTTSTPGALGTTTMSATTSAVPPATLPGNTTTTTGPQTTTAPPVSAPTVAPTRQLVNGVIRIAGTQFNTLLSNSTMRTELAAYVALDIARLLGIPVSCVVITSLSIGSLVVNYTVTTDALQTTTSSSVQQAASSATASSSWLVNTSALYAQVAPTETLSVASSTTTSASVTPAPVVGPTTSSPSGGSSSSSSSCGSACIGFYAAIAAAAVLVVGGGIFVLLGRPKRVIPAEDNTPPPTVPTARKPY